MARISKYLPLYGVGYDYHMAFSPPSLPLPPSPIPVPNNVYFVMANNILDRIFGKWSLQSNMTEGMGDILWQYDWGCVIFHQPFGPLFASPSQVLLTAFSSVKYFLPSYSVKENIDGGSAAGSGEAPVAISLPVYLIPTQDCQDIGGFGFVAPTSISMQSVSTRWVGFNLGDFVAGMIGMAGDAAMSAIISKLGGKIFPKTTIDDQIFAALGVAAVNLMIAFKDNEVVLGLGGAGSAVGGMVAFGLGVVTFPIALAVGLAPAMAMAVSMASGKAADFVGDNYGSDSSTVSNDFNPDPTNDPDYEPEVPPPPPPPRTNPYWGPGKTP